MSDIFLIYNGADLFCLPSFYEGFGLAAAEAISFQIPVIGFEDCIGLTEFIINNVNGVLLNRSNNVIDLLSDSIIRILTDSSEYVFLKNNCVLPDRFEPDFIASQWLELFKI